MSEIVVEISRWLDGNETPEAAASHMTTGRDSMTATGNALTSLAARFAPFAAAAASVVATFTTAASHAVEREAARITLGLSSPHVALTARALPAEHPSHVAVAALDAAQRDTSPAVLDDPRSAALAALRADDSHRATLALLTARELAASIATQTVWIWRRPISPRDPAPACLA